MSYVNTTINLNGIVFNIYCNDNDTIRKIKRVFDNMFAPNYNEIIGTKANYNIHFDLSEDNYNNMISMLANKECKILNPNIKEYTLDQYKIYHHYSQFFTYGLDNDYYVISNNKYSPYYVILELYLKEYERRKYYLFHGNGIIINNKGINIIGNSHSGKTTLMSKILQADKKDSSFLSNDRILLGFDKTLYFPIDLNLDKRTILNDLYLKDKINTDNEKIYVSPKQFISCYPNLSYDSNSTNNLILVPQIDLIERKRMNIREIKKADIIELLKYCCFTIEDKENPRDEWLKKSNAVDKDIDRLIEYLANEYKAILFEFGCDLEKERVYEKIRKEN